jgi:hypothetical protein
MAASPSKKTVKNQQSGPLPKVARSEFSEKLHQINDLAGADQGADDPQDVDLVRKTLREICGDATAPAAARAQAARTLAEMAQALGRHAAPATAPAKPVGQMTRAELEAEIANLGR